MTYEDTISETMFFPADQEMLYTHFTQMSMTDNLHSVRVQAINKLYLKSASVSSNMTVSTANPLVDGKLFLMRKFCFFKTIANVFRGFYLFLFFGFFSLKSYGYFLPTNFG